jgi:hypothetical protein
MKTPNKKLKKKIKEYKPPFNLRKWEEGQEEYYFERGRVQGLREKDTWHAVLIFLTFIGGLFLGWYYASLYILANLNG